MHEGLINPQQAASGGLLHDTVVVPGVHRKRAVGIKDTHTKIMYAACRDYSQDCAFLHPSDMNCSMMELPTVSGAVHPHSPTWRGVSGSLHPHVENCRQSQALCTPPHENAGTFQAVCTPMLKIADSLRLRAPPLTKMAGRLRLLALPG